MMKGSEMYTKIFASGALAKFLYARDRGASHQELTRLKSVAEAEVPPSRAGSKRRDGAGPKIGVSDTAVSHRSNVLDFINRAKFDRARLEVEWQSAPEN
jgi:hypothetical protein